MPRRTTVIDTSSAIRQKRRRIAVALGGAGVLAAATVTPAFATGSSSSSSNLVVIAKADNPRKLTFGPDGTLYVAVAGHGGKGKCVQGEEGDACIGGSGGVLHLSPGGKHKMIVSGLSSAANKDGASAGGPSGIAISGKTIALAIQGVTIDSKGHEPLGAAGAKLNHVVTASLAGGAVTTGPDLGSFEAKSNPDKKNAGSEINSDPYAITAYRGGWAVVDAAANDLLWISPTGSVSVLAVFPNTFATLKPALTGKSTDVTIPVDAVPDSITVGRDGNLYVGQLTGFPFIPGQADVFKVAPGKDTTKKVTPTVFAKGFTAISDLAFDPQGHLNVLEIATGPLLTGPGALLRVTNGQQVTIASKGLVAPTGLAIDKNGVIAVSNRGSSPATGSAPGEIVRVLT